MFFTSNRWPLLAALIFGGVVLSLFWYITLDDPPGEAVPAQGGTYVEAVARPPERVNPLFSSANETDAALVQLIFSGLVRLGPDGTPEPDLAERWEITNNGQRYLFHLRRGVAWHDGELLDADDVVFTYRQIADPDFAGDPSLKKLMQGVVVTARDPLTVEFELEQTYSPFLAYLTVGILPEHLLGGLSATQLFNAPFNQQPVGTGPYRLTEQPDGQTVRLSASSVYYFGPPFVSTMEFAIHTSVGDAAAAVRDGEADGVLLGEDAPVSDVDALRELDGVLVHDVAGAPFYQVYLNVNRAPLDDEEVRRALQQGVDTATLIATVGGGRGVPAVVGIPPETWAAGEIEPPPYNAGDAATDLELAGYFRARDGIRANSAGQRLAFSLLTTDDPLRMRIADEIARQWRFIGAAATVEVVDAGTFLDARLGARDFDAALLLVDAGPDPDLYPLWHSSQAGPPGLNFSGFRDSRLDNALERGRQTTDSERRKDLYDLSAGYLLTAMPAIPLYHPTYAYAQSRDLVGSETPTLLTPAMRFWNAASWYVATRVE